MLDGSTTRDLTDDLWLESSVAVDDVHELGGFSSDDVCMQLGDGRKNWTVKETRSCWVQTRQSSHQINIDFSFSESPRNFSHQQVFSGNIIAIANTSQTLYKNSPTSIELLAAKSYK